MKIKSKKGFTLMEMLIVVAIIAILVAIAIPVFTTVLEKSREASDLANIRNSYAEVMVAVLDDNAEKYGQGQNVVKLVQKKDGWNRTDTAQETLAKLGTPNGTPSAGGTCDVWYEAEAQVVHFDFEGSSAASGMISFPETSNIGGFAKSYAELVDKYIKDGVINNNTVDNWMQDYNGHKIVNISVGDGKFNSTIWNQAEADKYSTEVMDALKNKNNRPSDGSYTAYFNENRELIGYSYNDQATWTSQRHIYLKDANGNTIYDTTGNLGDAEAKGKLADYLWPQGN